MGEGVGNRKLAAILAADVVGYSSLMAKDEAGTLAALKEHRSSLFDPAVARHNGRVVKLIGDGTLVEFASVMDAVNCAMSIQLAALEDAKVNGSPIVLRIGINLGDVILDGDDIYGNGVNIAARLEPLAKPGGICISGVVKDSIEGRIDAPFNDGGPVSVKNIDRPVRVWQWVPSQDQGVQTTKVAPTDEGFSSIAVLPFENMSGDPEQEYFSDGISEDIITDLSKVSGLLVIARNSTFAYKGSNPDLRKVGRDLGVRTVLEGSVRKAGNRIRVTAQLIDAETGGHIWAERFDRDLTDIFEVQDEVTLSIVSALKVKLKPEEKERITSVGTTSTAAYDCSMRARAMLMGASQTADTYHSAMAYARKALEYDPNYAQAYLMLAIAELFDFTNFYTENATSAIDRLLKYVHRAIELDPQTADSWFILAIAHQHLREFEKAREAGKKALELDPNSAQAYLGRGSLAIVDARPADGIPDIERAMRLDPGYAHQQLHFLGMAHFFLGNYDTAAVMFRERLVLAPSTDHGRVMLVATLGWLGESDEAKKVWDELFRLHPQFSYEKRLGIVPFRDPGYYALVREGLEKAGVTEPK